MKQGRIENDRKKRTSRITSAAVLALVFIMGICIGTATTSLTSLSQSASAQFFMQTGTNFVVEPKAPMAVSQDGNNVYIVWWTNKSENWEVMFRASNDGGQTFGDKINLSNSSDTESQNAEMVAAGNNVFVSWWETSPETGSSESVLRVSNDAGQTFGPRIMLGVNGTISTATGNTTTTTTTATEGGAGGEQQQCQLEIITNEEPFEVEEPVTITVTNGGDEALEFPNSMLGLEIENRDTGETYPLFLAQVITALEPGESRTFEFTYEELVSEIGTGTIEASVSSSDGCSASTTFTLAVGSESNSLAANSTNMNSTNT